MGVKVATLKIQIFLPSFHSFLQFIGITRCGTLSCCWKSGWKIKMAFNWFGGIFIIFFNIPGKRKALGKFSLLARGRGAGGYKKKINTGRLCPEVGLLTLLYTILAEKIPLFTEKIMVTFSYTFHYKIIPISQAY